MTTLKMRAHKNTKENMISTLHFHHKLDCIRASSPIVCFENGGHVYHIECDKLDIELECFFGTAMAHYYGVWCNHTPFTIDAVFVFPLYCTTSILECTVNSDNLIRTTGLLRHSNTPQTSTTTTTTGATNPGTSNLNEPPRKRWCAEQMGLFAHQIEGQFRVPIFAIAPHQKIFIKLRCLHSVTNDGVHGHQLTIPLQFYHAQYPKYSNADEDEKHVLNGASSSQLILSNPAASSFQPQKSFSHFSEPDNSRTNTDRKWSEYVTLRCNIYYPQHCQPKVFSSSHEIVLRSSSSEVGPDCISMQCGGIKAMHTLLSANNHQIVDHDVHGTDFTVMWAYYTPKMNQRSRPAHGSLTLHSGVNGTQKKSRSRRTMSNVTQMRSSKGGGDKVLQFESHFILFKNEEESEDGDNGDVEGVLCITAPKSTDKAPVSTLPRFVLYVLDSQLMDKSYWNSVMKCVMTSINDLREHDHFNILLADGPDMHVFDESTDLCAADETSKSNAREWLMVEFAPRILREHRAIYNTPPTTTTQRRKSSSEHVLPETDILSAIHRSYKMLDSDNDGNHHSSVFLFTSSAFGQQQVRECAVCDQVQQNHDSADAHRIKPRIFTISIGADVNIYFLSRLSRSTHAQSLHIVNENVIETQIAAFLSGVRFCILANIAVEIHRGHAGTPYTCHTDTVDLFYPCPVLIPLTLAKADVDANDFCIKVTGLDFRCKRLEMMIYAPQMLTNRCAFPMKLLSIAGELRRCIAECWYCNESDEAEQALQWLQKTNAVSDLYGISTPFQPLVCFDVEFDETDDALCGVFSPMLSASDFNVGCGLERVLHEWMARTRLLLHSTTHDLINKALLNLNGCVQMDVRCFGATWQLSGTPHSKHRGADIMPHLSKVYDEHELHKIYQEYYYDEMIHECCSHCKCCIL